MARADILLFVQGTHPISRETIPSKCYEYFLTGIPVLGLIHENQELSSMLRQLGHVEAAAGDSDEIAEALVMLWQAWRSNSLPVPEPSPYTLERAVAQLLELLHP